MNPFTWDPSVGQYRYPNGRFVPRSAIRAALDSALEKEKRTVRALALAVRNGDISLSLWRQQMRDAIKNIHIYSAGLAKGGLAQLNQSDFGRLGNVIRSEYKYLERLATGLSNGSIPMDGRFMDRVLQYGEAGRDTYHRIETTIMKIAGYRYESNVLHPAEHCMGSNSCVEQTDRGRVLIGKLVPIGQRRCLRKCKCSKAYWTTLDG